MKTTTAILCLLLFWLLMPATAQNPRDIFRKAMNVSEPDAFEMTTTLTIYDAKGNKRVRETSMASKKFGETTKVIIKFLSPANVKGTGMLIFDYKDKDDDMWIYLPVLRKTRRIVSSEKSKSFMGSEFSNADMSRPSLDDFDYKLKGSDSIEGEDCWLIEVTPKTEKIADENGFSRKLVWIGKTSFYVYKSEYYDFDDELRKILHQRNHRQLGDGKALARQMEVENVQNGRRSVLTVTKLQAGSNLSESSFSTSMLER